MTGLQEEVRAGRNEASALRVELAVAKAEALIPKAVSIGDYSTRYSSRFLTCTTITLIRPPISTSRKCIEICRYPLPNSLMGEGRQLVVDCEGTL